MLQKSGPSIETCRITLIIFLPICDKPVIGLQRLRIQSIAFFTKGVFPSVKDVHQNDECYDYL